MAHKITQKNMPLGKAFDELEALTGEMESGTIDLEKSISKLRRGFELAKFLKHRLNQIENEINEIKDEFKDVLQAEQSDLDQTDETFE